MLLALALLACEPNPVGVDSGLPETQSEEFYEFLEDVGIVRLEQNAQGHEQGVAFSDDNGLVAFWSDAHEGYFVFTTEDLDDEAGQSGIEVQIELGDERGNVMVIDRSGTYMPLWYGIPIGERGEPAELLIDGRAMAAGDDQPGTWPEGENPFEGEPPFTIAGVTISSGMVRTVGRNMLDKAAIYALTNAASSFMTNICLVANPLHEDWCGEVVANIMAAAEAFKGGVTIDSLWQFTFELAGVPLTEKQFYEKIIDEACGQTAALVGWMLPSSVVNVQEEYRRLVWQHDYFLTQVALQNETLTPEQSASLASVSGVITAMAPMQRSYFLEVMDEAQDLSDTLDSLLEFMEEMLETKPEFESEAEFYAAHEEVWSHWAVSPDLWQREYTFYQTRFEQEQANQGPGDDELNVSEKIAECTVSMVEEVTVHIQDEAAWLVSIESLNAAAIAGGQAVLAQLYRDVFDDEIPDDFCLPDLEEPNASWEDAIKNPHFWSVGQSSARIADLTLCDSGGGADDDDWYVFQASAINIRAQIRLVGELEDGEPAGAGYDHEICADLYWYDQAYEMMGWPPDKITGGCGTIEDGVETAQVGVASTTGVHTSWLIAHVYPKNRSDARELDAGVDYILTIAE